MTDHKEHIRAVAARVLEDWSMFMLDEQPSELSIFETDDIFFCSQLKFKGPVNGSYVVICQKPFMLSLANNLLGENGNVSDQDQADALGELVNVLCGNMLTEVYGTDVVFELTPPHVSAIEPEQLPQFVNPLAVGFSADENPVLITFQLDAA